MGCIVARIVWPLGSSTTPSEDCAPARQGAPLPVPQADRLAVHRNPPAQTTPTSFITDIASGRTELGFVPALSTVKRSPASRRNRPSAICDRAEFPVDGISKFISGLHTTKLRTKFGGLVFTP